MTNFDQLEGDLRRRRERVMRRMAHTELGEINAAEHPPNDETTGKHGPGDVLPREARPETISSHAHTRGR